MNDTYKKHYDQRVIAEGPVVGYKFTITIPNYTNVRTDSKIKFSVRKTTYIYAKNTWNNNKENKKFPACASLGGRHNTLLECVQHAYNSIGKLFLANCDVK